MTPVGPAPGRTSCRRSCRSGSGCLGYPPEPFDRFRRRSERWAVVEAPMKRPAGGQSRHEHEEDDHGRHSRREALRGHAPSRADLQASVMARPSLLRMWTVIMSAVISTSVSYVGGGRYIRTSGKPRGPGIPRCSRATSSSIASREVPDRVAVDRHSVDAPRTPTGNGDAPECSPGHLFRTQELSPSCSVDRIQGGAGSSMRAGAP